MGATTSLLFPELDAALGLYATGERVHVGSAVESVRDQLRKLGALRHVCKFGVMLWWEYLLRVQGRRL